MDITLFQIATPAVAGLVGVSIGSIFTLWGQKVERVAKREDELRKNTVDIFASSMVYSATINQVINRDETGLSGDALEAVLEKLNTANQTIHDKGVMLSIVDAGVLGKSAIAFSNEIAQATTYLHPAEGAGAPEGFTRASQILDRVDFYRECLASIARAPRRNRKRVADRLNLKIEALEQLELLQQRDE